MKNKIIGENNHGYFSYDISKLTKPHKEEFYRAVVAITNCDYTERDSLLVKEYVDKGLVTSTPL